MGAVLFERARPSSVAPPVRRPLVAAPRRPGTPADLLRLQRTAGNAAVVAELRARRGDAEAHSVQRCGTEVHPGCPCAEETATVQRDSAAVVQRACPTTRPAGEKAASKGGTGLLSPDVRFDRAANKVFVADFAVDGAAPPTGVTTEPDWERAMSFIAGTPSIGPIVAILGYSDCLGPENRNNALRKQRADAVLALMPPLPRTKVIFATSEYAGNYLGANDTAEQRARNRAAVITILPPTGPKGSDACDMLARATDLDQYFFLVRCLERRLGLTKAADAPKVLSVLRQIYYGSAGWTLPENRNPIWDDVVTARPWLPGTDPGPMIGKKLFAALAASQTIQNNGKDVDLGHLLTGMDAARQPENVEPKVGPIRLGTNVKNHEWATWAGDVGSGAAQFALCTTFMTYPPDPKKYFAGYASDQDLDGDIDAYGMWAALNEGTPDVGLRLGIPLSDALLDYYRTTNTNPGKGHADRYEIFANFYGGDVKAGVIGKPAQLHDNLLPSVQEFALLFFGDKLRKALGGIDPGGCFGTFVPPAPGRTVDLGTLLLAVATAADTMTAFFVEWLKKRV